jgi:hypothetical protein
MIPDAKSHLQKTPPAESLSFSACVHTYIRIYTQSKLLCAVYSIKDKASNRQLEFGCPMMTAVSKVSRAYKIAIYDDILRRVRGPNISLNDISRQL